MRLRPEQLGKHLADRLLPAYLVAGDEPLQQGELLDDLRRAARDQGFDERHRFSSDTGIDWNSLLNESQSMSLFGGLAASGWHTAATTMRLLVESVPFFGGLIGAGGEISWPRATRPGDAIRLRSEVTAVTPSRSRPERGMVNMRCETVNQHDEVVQVFTPKIVAWRRTLL